MNDIGIGRRLKLASDVLVGMSAPGEFLEGPLLAVCSPMQIRAITHDLTPASRPVIVRNDRPGSFIG